MPATPKPPLVRFFGLTQPEGECLIWKGTTAGTKSKAGYFNPTTSPKGPKVRAHRWIYEQLVGPIPEGMEIDHVRERGCIGPLCVNVLHLEVVTHEENMLRTRLKVCRSGKHDLTLEENQSFDSQGRRRGCAACRRDREAARPPRRK